MSVPNLITPRYCTVALFKLCSIMLALQNAWAGLGFKQLRFVCFLIHEHVKYQFNMQQDLWDGNICTFSIGHYSLLCICMSYCLMYDVFCILKS